jgi:hypothetical protein
MKFKLRIHVNQDQLKETRIENDNYDSDESIESQIKHEMGWVDESSITVDDISKNPDWTDQYDVVVDVDEKQLERARINAIGEDRYCTNKETPIISIQIEIGWTAESGITLQDIEEILPNVSSESVTQ